MRATTVRSSRSSAFQFTRSQPPLAHSVPSRIAGRFTSRVGGGSAFYVRRYSNTAGWSFAPVVLPAASLILAGAVLAAPALSRADTIYVAGPDGGGQSIERLDSFTGGRLGTFATTSGFPKGLDFDTAGNLYVATAYSIIQKFNPTIGRASC